MLQQALFLSLAVVTVNALGSVKNITVTGQCACSSKAVNDAKIELWEHDTADPDDLLNTTKPVQKGRFEVYGEQSEIGNIEPYLLITHSCDNGQINPKCTITDRYNIPKEHIGGTYKMGIVSLNIGKKGRKKNCV